MGLDIYLYRYENRHETERLEAEYSRRSEEQWDKVGEYSSLTESQKNQLRDDDKKLAAELGLKDGGEDPRKQSIERVCDRYPDHYFKIGYFRSSYNGGGINSVLRNFGLPDLYDIFSRDDNAEYVWAPDWMLALIKVQDCISRLRLMDNIRCFEVGSFNMTPETDSSEKAIQVFLKEKERESSFDGYSNRNGHFHIKEPLKVYGLITGSRKQLFGEGQIPCVYVVSEGDNEWYIQALEIVQETIEFVLSQPDKDKYFLHWSS